MIFLISIVSCAGFRFGFPRIVSDVTEGDRSYFKSDEPVFKFAPEEGEEFFLPHGWKNLESRSKLKTAATLNRLSEEMMNYAAIPEPEGPKGAFAWLEVCLFENVKHGG